MDRSEVSDTIAPIAVTWPLYHLALRQYNTIQLKKLGKELILPRPFPPENGVFEPRIFQSNSFAVGTTRESTLHPDYWEREDQFLAEVNLEDLKSTLGANQEYWLLAIRMAREASRQRRNQQTMHPSWTNT
jgi:hypothetical protein